MSFISVAIAGGILYAGARAYKETPWTNYLEKLERRKSRRRKKNRLVPLLRPYSTTVLNKVPILRFKGQDLRQAQMREIASVSDKGERSEAEKQADQRLAVAFTALGLTVAGQLLYAPLNLLGAVCILYLNRQLSRKAYHAIVKEHRLTVEAAECLFVPMALITGHYLAMSIGHTIFHISEKIMVKTEDHSTTSLINIFGKQPRFIWILKDNVEVRIPFEELNIEDQVVINAGEMIPVDGTITSGIASIDQRILTGESQPTEKGVGAQVFASTVVLSGRISISAEKAGEETVAAQIGQILSQTKDFKSYVRSQAVEQSDNMVPLRLALSAIALPLLGGTGALTVLNARFCNQMRVTGPLAMLNFLQIASHNGILIKDGRSLELLSKVDTVVFDKTGTLTEEQPYVGTIYTCHGYQKNEVLYYAAAAEYKQTHPIALAILEEANRCQLNLPEIREAQYEVGYGIRVSLSEQLIRVGSGRFMEMEGIIIPSNIKNSEHEAHELGYSLVYVAIDQHLGGAIEFRPTIRPEAKRIIEYLKQRQIGTYIISGDHHKPTQKLAETLGIENYFAETLPENKAALVEQLQNEGRFVCFVGDGINDSIALKKANVSISLSGASTIATDTAQMILMDETLNQLSQAFEIADNWHANMRTAVLTSTIPQTIIVSGAFFLGFGILSSIVLNLSSLSIGVGNAMLPLFHHQSQTNNGYHKS